MIAEAAGLKNVEWNGYLKHYKPSERVIDAQKKVQAENMDQLYQQMFSQRKSIIDQAMGNGTGYNQQNGIRNRNNDNNNDKADNNK
mmetsp:Transcript_2027/g.1749  ORF Transcript_2027/g.1749 Transcript_2027/m.1749 type:complete len:86 (+) Transcript_2027:3-260(+)